jgi:hypothetical protein
MLWYAEELQRTLTVKNPAASIDPESQALVGEGISSLSLFATMQQSFTLPDLPNAYQRRS